MFNRKTTVKVREEKQEYDDDEERAEKKEREEEEDGDLFCFFLFLRTIFPECPKNDCERRSVSQSINEHSSHISLLSIRYHCHLNWRVWQLHRSQLLHPC